MMDVDVGSRVRREVGSEGGSGGAGSSALGGGNKQLNYIGAPRAESDNVVFEHTHLMNTWGNAYKIFSYDGQGVTSKVLITSLGCLPVHMLSFWMTYSEYLNLPTGSRVEAVECVITPKGFKTSFDTGVSITSSANNTQGVFGQVAVGLNRCIDSRHYLLERDATQPMKATSLTYAETHDTPERLWGHHLYDDKFDNSIPTILGIARTIPVYMGVVLAYKASDNGKLTQGWPELMKYTKTFNLLDHMETPCVHYRYKVKTNVIKPKETINLLHPHVSTKAAMGGEDICVTLGEEKKDNTFTISRVTEFSALKKTDPSFDNYSKEVIEHCYSVSIPDHTPPNSGNMPWHPAYGL